MFRGAHAIKSWSTNQTIIALSSAEAELYALLKGASQVLGLTSMGWDFGDELSAGLWSDASAAIAISQRSGLGKLRHIPTQYLWLQERVSAKEISLEKVLGTANPADMLTKNLAKADLDRHLEFSNLIVHTGRADGSLQVNALSAWRRPLSDRVAAALASASRSWLMVGTSKVGLPPSSVGGTIP